MSLASTGSAVPAASTCPASGTRPAFIQAVIRLFLSRRFATFIVFGGLAALANIAVGKTLYSVPAIAEIVPYWLAVAIGSACGLLVNFGLNYAFNFNFAGRSAGAQLRTFVVVAVGGVTLTALIAHGLVASAAWIELSSPVRLAGMALDIAFIAHVMATGLVTFYSFAAHSAFSFNVGLRSRLVRAFSR